MSCGCLGAQQIRMVHQQRSEHCFQYPSGRNLSLQAGGATEKEEEIQRGLAVDAARISSDPAASLLVAEHMALSCRTSL